MEIRLNASCRYPSYCDRDSLRPAGDSDWRRAGRSGAHTPARERVRSVSLDDENDPHRQHDTAADPVVAQGARRRAVTVPVIQISRAVIWSGFFALCAIASITVGVVQFRNWDAQQMTVAQGQAALFEFIALTALGVFFALAALVTGATAVLIIRQTAAVERVAGWNGTLIKQISDLGSMTVGQSDQLKAMMIEQFRELARLIGQQELRNEEHQERVALRLAEFRTKMEQQLSQLGQVTHRIEQVEAKVEQVGKGGTVGKAVAADIGAMRAELQVLRRDHDELSEDVGRALPSRVIRMRPARPTEGT